MSCSIHRSSKYERMRAGEGGIRVGEMALEYRPSRASTRVLEYRLQPYRRPIIPTDEGTLCQGLGALS